MIFVTVGSREYPFDRLLMKLDDLCAEGRLPEPLFAQIGQSPYVPKHYDFVRYLDTDAFYRCQSEASLVISHAGTGRAHRRAQARQAGRLRAPAQGARRAY